MTMSDYSAGTIEVLEGLDPVRKRPGMYTDTENPNHLAQEVIDNGVDEALAGFANQLDVIIHADGSISVQDNGRGMPTDKHPQFNMTGVELILTRLHSGAKFNHDNYAFSGGLHGVGVSVVNALASKVEVTVKRSGQCTQFIFVDGVCREIETISASALARRGTRLRFWPNPIYFDCADFDTKALERSLHTKAMLCPGFAVSFYIEKTEQKFNWCYESGMVEYVRSALKDDEVVINEVVHADIKDEDGAASWALMWTTRSNALQESFVNLISTPQGGTHVNGLRNGVYEAIKEFADIHNLLPKGIKLKADDACINMGFVLSTMVKEPQFAGQTKQKLNNSATQTYMQTAVKNHMILWLNQNVKIAETLLESVIEAARKRQLKSKQIERKKAVSGPSLPGKLIDCLEKDVSQTEIFLVEGDSASGTVKQARDRKTQAILPLRGKILNTWELDSDVILKSQEIHDISVAIGLSPGQVDLSGLRYGKVCVLADADSDGHHIATLLCALFLKHFPELVRAGHLYIAMPPLFRIDVGKDVYYAASDAEKNEILVKVPQNRKVTVMRFKGLGEMSPTQLRETTIKAGDRRLAQVVMPEETVARELMEKLLAKKRVSSRREWIEEFGNQATTE